MMKKYYVGLSILNVFEIEAENEEEAEEKVRDLSIEDTLEDADYNVSYVELIKEYA
jgi:hypothetical protein